MEVGLTRFGNLIVDDYGIFFWTRHENKIFT